MGELNLSQDEAGEALALRFAEAHKVTAPVLDLPALAAEAFRADVAFLRLPSLEAATCRDPETDAVLIAVSLSSNPERQRFSLAHEIGHLVAGHLNHSDANEQGELLAHAVARHLLLPRAALSDFVGGVQLGAADLRGLSDIVEHFQVSGIVACLQLRRFGLISANTFAQWSEIEASALAVRFGWAESHALRVGAAQTPIPPRRMGANATSAYLEHLLPLPTVAAVEGVSVGTLRNTFEAAGIIPEVTGVDVSLDDL